MTTNINADNGVVSGIAGLKTSADNSGVLALQTNGTTALTVDTLQNVGIGRTPVTYGSFKVLDVAGSSGAIQKWVHTGSSVQLQAYASSSVTAVGSATNHPLTLVTNDTERLRLNTSGTVILQGGSTSATGVGITFPATQSASSDANTLDDYEEGTFTPNQGGGLTVVGTFSSTGNYIKIGKMVTVQVSLSASTSITINSGDATMFTNLPFASSPTRNPGVAVNIAHSAGLFVNIASTTVYSCGSLISSATIFVSITYQTS